MFLVGDASMSEMLGRCGMDSLGEFATITLQFVFRVFTVPS